jgi:hypothetical protein
MYAKLATLVAAALSIVSLATPAHAQSVQFQASIQRTCLEDTAGFDANLQPNPLPANPPPGSVNFIRRTHTSELYVLTFNADGSFTSQGSTTTIRSNNSVGESTFSCAGTFAVNADLSVDTTITPACPFQEANGESGTVAGGGSHLKVAQGIGHLLISSPHPPHVETVNVTTNPGGSPFSFERVCGRSGSAGQLGQ